MQVLNITHNLYRDDNLPDDVVPKYWGHRGHKEDILCLAYCEPNVLASASYDGDIIVWDVDGEKKLIKLNAYDNASRSGKKQLVPHGRQIHKKNMDAMKYHMKKVNANMLTMINSPDTFSTTSSNVYDTSNSSTPNTPEQFKGNPMTPSTNRRLSRLKDIRTATNHYNIPDLQPCLKDWDKSNLSCTDRAVEKVSIYILTRYPADLLWLPTSKQYNN